MECFDLKDEQWRCKDAAQVWAFCKGWHRSHYRKHRGKVGVGTSWEIPHAAFGSGYPGRHSSRKASSSKAMEEMWKLDMEMRIINADYKQNCGILIARIWMWL
jgi:hypothetical protein